ncbi:MAG: HAD-IC family P-type ATPase [Acidimicrobiales bacterium]
MIPESTQTQLTDWSSLDGSEVADRLIVDPLVGLSTAEVQERQEIHGLNRLAEPPRRSRVSVFLDQFRAGIVYVLAGAGIIAGLLGDIKDLVIIFIVLLLNAILGYLQEAKASNALAALERMLVTRVRVRRNGDTDEVSIDQLVPGDVVLLGAGDRVPADGRLLLAANLSVDESSLTGESVPVEKQSDAVTTFDAPIGDRIGMVFMNTTVSRGRAEVVVTGTGMSTEMGKVAELLVSAKTSKTPLERQLDELSKVLAVIAGVAATLVFFVQFYLERDFTTAILGAVALAVAAIPEGLPAVVTVTLAIGISKMAKENAIVKRLHSVETLGSTSVICSDKTGTLTLNQMTAHQAFRGGELWMVSGGGYGTAGSITSAGSDPVANEIASRALLSAALCSDVVLVPDAQDGPGIIGDPTEAALVVLAAKAGLDATNERIRRPRLAEIPFESATKYMATFHRFDPDDAQSDVLLCVKGAPDVVIALCDTFMANDGSVCQLDSAERGFRSAENERLAEQGMRVLALATRRLSAAEVTDTDEIIVDPEQWISGLQLELLVGIVDPARTEAKNAIALCHRAGIDVKMITGDHAITAATIASQLGIEGEVVTGDDLDVMSDEELAERIGAIAVCARVSPEHKVRVIEALRSNGEIVAMTGDGVNDAAALRRADIGVAMGITGTEVTKEAGDMVLTDDNFATIVAAVRGGRAVFDNILKFVRFQVATAVGAIATILGASIAGQPTPFTPLQVLWVNLIADGPTAVTLGVDKPAPDLMQRSPVAADSPILNRKRISQVAYQGIVTAVGVLALYLYAINEYEQGLPDGETPKIAMTMAFTAFVIAQLVNVYNARSETASLFSRYTFTNWKLGLSVVVVFLLQILITEFTPMLNLFDTAQLSVSQWGLCLIPPFGLLIMVELWKVFARRSANSAVQTKLEHG